MSPSLAIIWGRRTFLHICCPMSHTEVKRWEMTQVQITVHNNMSCYSHLSSEETCVSLVRWMSCRLKTVSFEWREDWRCCRNVLARPVRLLSCMQYTHKTNWRYCKSTPNSAQTYKTIAQDVQAGTGELYSGSSPWRQYPVALRPPLLLSAHLGLQRAVSCLHPPQICAWACPNVPNFPSPLCAPPSDSWH